MPVGPLAALRLGAGACWVADAALRVYAVKLAGVAPEAPKPQVAERGEGALAAEVAAAAAEARGLGRLEARHRGVSAPLGLDPTGAKIIYPFAFCACQSD